MKSIEHPLDFNYALAVGLNKGQCLLENSTKYMDLDFLNYGKQGNSDNVLMGIMTHQCE